MTTTNTPKSQSDKFIEAARDLDCDDDDARFKERVVTIVRHVKKVFPSDMVEDKEFRKTLMKQEKGE